MSAPTTTTYRAIIELPGARVEVEVKIEDPWRDSGEVAEVVQSAASRLQHQVVESRARAELPF